jgi:D-psicose/D-tagatose/L-ribulose 3-epimerase
MKLAISNIAWLADEDELVLPILKEYGVQGIEVAPSKYWRNPIEATRDDILEKKNYLNSAGFDVPAAQSLLFGHPELTIFQDNETRNRTMDYLVRLGILCSQMGAKVLVFGSPKNRKRSGLSMESASDIATDFFYSVAEKIASFDIKICIEPNPKEYDCDFINTTLEGLELVKRVNHPNFRLHLDASAMTLNDENPSLITTKVLLWTAHVHISEPHLELIGSGTTNHDAFAEALKSQEYDGWISLEMRSGLLPNNLDSISQALDFTNSVYFK